MKILLGTVSVLLLFLIVVGLNPASVRVAEAGHTALAFVVNRAAATVEVYNADTRAFVASIDVGVGGSKPTELAVTPDQGFVYVTLTGVPAAADGVIKVISVASLTVVDTIAAPSSPWGIAITPNGDFAYVSDMIEAKVRVLRLSDNTFIDTISHPSFDTPQGIAISPNGSHVFVANVAFRGNPTFPLLDDIENVTVIATATNTVIATVDVTAEVTTHGPWDVTILPDGTKVYSNDGDDGEHVFEIDSTAHTLTNVIDIAQVPGDENGPRGMDSGLTPVGVRVYAGLMESDEIVVIDPADNSFIRVTTPTTSAPWRVRLNTDGTELWVSLRDNNEVLVLDTLDNSEIATISGFDQPADIAFVEPNHQVPVGGVTSFLADDSGPSAAVIIFLTGGIVGGLGVLATTAWYTRRRWLRS